MPARDEADDGRGWDAPGGGGGPVRMGTAVAALPGVGPGRWPRFKRLGLETVADLLRHLPLRYEWERAEGTVEQLVEGSIGTVVGEVVARRVAGFGRKTRFEATLQDETGTLQLVWFNAGYLRDRLHAGMVVRAQGKVKAFGGYPQMVNPKWSAVDPDEDAGGAEDDRYRPVYPQTDGLPSAVIESVVHNVLSALGGALDDPLPEALAEANAMPGLAEAYRMVHAPRDEDEPGAGRRRLAYNELLLLQLGVVMKRAYVDTRQVSPALRWSDAVDAHIRERFAFELTGAQDRVVREVAADLQGERPMNRLVQGDVGSGKTAVALYAMLMAAGSGKQAALMAPTELLAEQHHASIAAALAGSGVTVALLTGHTKDRAAVEAGLAGGSVDLVVGTHALLFGVPFKDLAVAVVDEQHRFGVEQRAKLRGGDEGARDERGRLRVPHVLIMTATPIPRTLSLTVFGDLDVSTIDELPPGRTPIVTRVTTAEKADAVYGYARDRVAQGEQVYVVVPSVEAGSTTQGGAALKSVAKHAKLLQQKYFDGYTVASVHGQLKPETRERTMRKFRDGAADVLVATTVIEVGVDVPNATMMVVEHAERFGLAQLHQLRGRIGRGASRNKPVCALVAEPTTEDAARRMEAIASTTDGFKIAELDLEIRGMGEFFGTRQAGGATFRLARLPEDLDLVKLARRDAEALLAADPSLDRAEHARLRSVLMQQHGKDLGLIDVG